MAQPKKKTSKARTDSRRSQIKLSLPAIVFCEKCHQRKVKHMVCSNCGSYNNSEVIKK